MDPMRTTPRRPKKDRSSSGTGFLVRRRAILYRPHQRLKKVGVAAAAKQVGSTSATNGSTGSSPKTLDTLMGQMTMTETEGKDGPAADVSVDSGLGMSPNEMDVGVDDLYVAIKPGSAWVKDSKGSITGPSTSKSVSSIAVNEEISLTPAPEQASQSQIPLRQDPNAHHRNAYYSPTQPEEDGFSFLDMDKIYFSSFSEWAAGILRSQLAPIPEEDESEDD